MMKNKVRVYKSKALVAKIIKDRKLSTKNLEYSRTKEHQ